MLTCLILGVTYGFAAAVQPGQFQAYLLSHTMTHGWRRTVPAVFAPLLSDLPVSTFVLVVLTQIPQTFLHVLQLAGGLFLLYLALAALKATRHFQQSCAAPVPIHQTILKAALVNLLNPNPYLAWALIIGPLLIKVWHESPLSAVGFLSTFYASMILISAAMVMLLAAARSLGPRIARVLVGLSAVALAGFGLYQLGAGSTALLSWAKT